MKQSHFHQHVFKFFVQLLLLNFFLVKLSTIHVPSLKRGRERARDLCASCNLQEP